MTGALTGDRPQVAATEGGTTDPPPTVASTEGAVKRSAAASSDAHDTQYAPCDAGRHSPGELEEVVFVFVFVVSVADPRLARTAAGVPKALGAVVTATAITATMTVAKRPACLVEGANLAGESTAAMTSMSPRVSREDGGSASDLESVSARPRVRPTRLDPRESSALGKV